eukprot:317504-Rhodomonas_salina.2
MGAGKCIVMFPRLTCGRPLSRSSLAVRLTNDMCLYTGPIPLKSDDDRDVQNARGTRSCIHFRYIA